MNMSPLTRKVLNLASSLLQASLDIFVHQVILFFLAESLVLEARIFMTGIIVIVYFFASLYGFEALKRPYNSEKFLLVRSWLLIAFLSILFYFTSEAPVSISEILISLASFMCINFFMRYSLRHVLASKPNKFFRPVIKLFSAAPAHADTEGPTGEIDTSLRKDYRHDMKNILAKKSKIYKFIKRAFDIFSSGAALLLLSPVFLVTAIAIKLEDGGPVIYSANRWGKDMKNFRMHKFRSMKVNAEAMLKDLLKDSEMTGHAFKIKNDPRITRVGHFIRKYSIDELPQLWNIFTGDMSVVGPRAIMTVATDTIDDYEKQRWLVQPGLTCYWQVSGRANIKWAQWVEMDLDYIENMSITEDIKLIFKTFPVVFKADGAY